MSADKYPCIFSREMEAIVYIMCRSVNIPLRACLPMFCGLRWTQLRVYDAEL